MKHFSVSQLTTYLNCPDKYRFGYIEKQPWEFQPVDMVFGTVCHQTVAHFHSTNCELGEMVANFERRWEKAIAQVENIRFRSLDQVQLLTRGKRLMELYHQQFEDLTPQDVELFFELPMLDLATGRYVEQAIQGRIDLIADDCVHEVKTSSKSYTQDQADTSLQLTFYSWAYQYLYGKPASGLKLIALVKTKEPKIQVLETKREMADYSRLYSLMTGVMNAIQKGVFYPNPMSIYGCGNCQFQQLCSGKEDS